MSAVDRLLDIARAEIGYLEKGSNDQLDDKTANAGRNNWTKYSAQLDKLGFYNGPKNGFAWCDAFCDWCFVQAFGLENALKMTGQKKGGLGAACPYSVKYYQAINAFHVNGPKPGDQIFFKMNGEYTHTGLVEKVLANQVVTIEGNTSGGTAVIPNGGGVYRKTYSLTSPYIGGYGRPNYSLVEDDIMTGPEILNALTDEQAYNLLLKAQKHAEKIKLTNAKMNTELASAKDAGITDGSNPMKFCTRAEAAIMANRAKK